MSHRNLVLWGLLLFLTLGLRASILENGYRKDQCTYYAASVRPDLLVEFRAHAKDWDDKARTFGFPVDNVPQTGDIVVFEAGVLGADPDYGHVAQVGWTSQAEFEFCGINWGKTAAERSSVTCHTATVVPGLSFIHKKGDVVVQQPPQGPGQLPTPTPQPQPTSAPSIDLGGLPDMYDPLAIVRWTVQKVESGNIQDLAAAVDESNLGNEFLCALGYSGRFIGCGAIKVGIDEASSLEDYAVQLASAVTTNPVCLGYWLDDQYYPFKPLRLQIYFANMPLNEAATGYDPQTDIGIVAFGAPEDEPFQLVEIAQGVLHFVEDDIDTLESCP